MLRLLAQKTTNPSAVILDGITLQSTPESGERAGSDGYKRKKGSKVHIAVDTLGHLLALSVTSANEQERAQAADLIKDVQEITGEKVQEKPSVALSCCPDAGSWNAPSLGPVGFAASLAITSVCPRLSPASIGSPFSP